MKKIFTACATLALVSTVNASNESFIYHGFERGNPDLYAGYSATEQATAVQPGIGDSSDSSRWVAQDNQTSYDFFVMNNPDTYSGESPLEAATYVVPGIGDSAYGRPARLYSFETSYDSWVRGNPDQESGF